MGHWTPSEKSRTARVPPIDMTPWPHAKACAVTLLSCVVALYCLFSPLGVVGGMGSGFVSVMAGLVVLNAVIWQRSVGSYG